MSILWREIWTAPADIASVFGLAYAHIDPAIGRYGLANFVFPVGAAAARILARNHGHRYYDWTYQDGVFRFFEHPVHFTREQAYEGKYVIQTEEPSLSAVDAVRLYKELSEVERAFANLKDVLDMRPIYADGPESGQCFGGGEIETCGFELLFDCAVEQEGKRRDVDVSFDAVVGKRRRDDNFLAVTGNSLKKSREISAKVAFLRSQTKSLSSHCASACSLPGAVNRLATSTSARSLSRTASRRSGRTSRSSIVSSPNSIHIARAASIGPQSHAPIAPTSSRTMWSSSAVSPCRRRPSLLRSRCVASKSRRPRLMTVR
jgi:hypothetical protein